VTTGELARLVLGLQLASTWTMVGVIWTVQLVHYPLMALADRDRYIEFQSEHQRRIGLLVVPVMLVELATALVLALAPWSPMPAIQAWIGLALLTAIWASTFFVQVPLHARLAQSFDASAHRILVRTNWMRTVAWTARGLLLLAIVFKIH
jgi:hypothetical protein